MKRLFIVSICLLALSCRAGEIILGSAGQSNYQIIVPDKFEEEDIAVSVRQAADLVERAFAENGMTLHIAAESKADKNRPGIYLGATELASKNGIMPSKMTGWQYVHKAVGANIVIAGHDRQGNLEGSASKRRYLSWYGTLKGTCEFLRQYAGVRFLMPGDYGIEFVPTPVISVPGDLNALKRPYLDANDYWGTKGDVFFVANSLMPFQNMNDYFGHSHPKAVPAEKYWKEHPEYFALVNGKRICTLRGSEGERLNQLCLSNPDVQALIYKRILDDIDEGHEIAEVGQCDGFKPCECEACFNLYGIKPVASRKNAREWINDPAWAEKLWIMHLEMAGRLTKDRPGGKMMILAYSVTASPPKTFDTFPGNVIIELARCSPEYFDPWRKMKGIEWFAAYIYNWGTYQMTSYMPMRSPKFIEDQVRLLVDNNVHTVRTHGFGQNDGLEGPSQYTYVRMLDDPKANPSSEKLVEEYIQAAFGEAADPMRRFFSILHARLEFNRYLTKTATDKNPLFVINALFTPDLMDSLDAQLASAEKKVKKERAKTRTAMVRCEFEYLRLTANAARAYYNYLALKDKASLDMAVAAVEARNKWIKNLPVSGKNAKDVERISMNAAAFRGVGKEGLRLPKFLNIAPFNWDTGKMHSEKADMPGTKTVSVLKTDSTPSINSPAWEKSPSSPFENAYGGKAGAETKFQILYDSRNLYIRFDADLPAAGNKLAARGRDAELWLQEAIDFCLSPSSDRDRFYHFSFEPLPDSFYDAANGFITDTLDPLFGKDDITWNPEWKYENSFAPDEKKWISMATVPFESLGVAAPAKGDVWLGNFGRAYFGSGKREHSLWSGKGIGKNSFDGKSFGELVFK